MLNRLGPLIRVLRGRRSRPQPLLVYASPLRRADPRTKLALALAASLAVMLPLERLAIFMVCYALLMLWARLVPQVLWQVWRLRWVLIGLFLVDWWLVSLEHAATITLRLSLLGVVFTLFFATTSSSELAHALEKMGVSYRYAFGLSLAFRSVALLDDEWRAIQEAQAARGIRLGGGELRAFLAQVRQLVALTVPAIVLTTRRAWSVTEAAHARGFDSPNRRPYPELRFTALDGWLLGGGLLLVTLIFMVR